MFSCSCHVCSGFQGLDARFAPCQDSPGLHGPLYRWKVPPVGPSHPRRAQHWCKGSPKPKLRRCTGHCRSASLVCTGREFGCFKLEVAAAVAGLQFRCMVQVKAGPKKVSCRAEACSSRSLNDVKCLHVRFKNVS